MKQSYFPYLPNSRYEDNKRYRYINEMMEKNPFTYHKRKNISSFYDSNNVYPQLNLNLENENALTSNNLQNNNGNDINQELLVFQKANEKYINSFNNFMRQKSSNIENNAHRYLNYITKNNKSYSINDNLNILPENTNYVERNNNKEKSLNRKKFKNKSTTDLNVFYKSKINDEYKINDDHKSNIIEKDVKNFTPGSVKARGSDITNPFFYDRIAKEIIKRNQEAMDYNIKKSENKYFKNKNLWKYSDDKLAVDPGKLNNPNYYTLGDSVLDRNPILNKGQYSPSFLRNYKFFSRQNDIFDVK